MSVFNFSDVLIKTTCLDMHISHFNEKKQKNKLIAKKGGDITPEIWNWYKFEKLDEQVYIK